MGLRFRKSIKIAPGVKLNIGKKSAGVSLGGKHGGVSFNTRSGAHARVSAPGTGLSYSSKIGGNSENTNNTDSSPSEPPKGGGCLITGLKILCIILFLPLLILFGWIPGIAWLIFLRKKLADDPDKQKKYTIIVSVLSAISLFIMIYSVATSSPQTTEPPISSETEKTTDNETKTKTSDDSKNTEDTSDDIKPQEEKKDSTSNSNTTSTANQNNSNGNSSTTVVTPVPEQPVEQPAAQPQEQPQEQPTEQTQDTPVVSPTSPSTEMVWIDDTAAKYHRKPDCSGMDHAYQVSIADAEALGRTPCKKCYR